MANKNYKFNSPLKSSWLNRNLILTLSLYFATYLVFGWLIASRVIEWTKLLSNSNIVTEQLSEIIHWGEFLFKQDMPLGIFLEEDFLLSFLKLLSLFVIIIITFLLSHPVALTTFLFQESINSDLKGFIAILSWSIILVFAFTSFDYLADLLVLIAVNILLRFDLRKLKYNNWQIILTTLFCATIAFSGGMLLFDHFSHH